MTKFIKIMYKGDDYSYNNIDCQDQPQKSGDRSQFSEANDPVDSFDGIDEVKEEIITVFQVNKIDARVLNDIEKVDGETAIVVTPVDSVKRKSNKNTI